MPHPIKILPMNPTWNAVYSFQLDDQIYLLTTIGNNGHDFGLFTEHGLCQRIFQGHRNPIACFSHYSHHGVDYVVSICSEGIINRWNVKTGECLPSMECRPTQGIINCHIQLEGDNPTLFVLDGSGDIHKINLSNPRSRIIVERLPCGETLLHGALFKNNEAQLTLVTTIKRSRIRGRSNLLMFTRGERDDWQQRSLLKFNAEGIPPPSEEHYLTMRLRDRNIIVCIDEWFAIGEPKRIISVWDLETGKFLGKLNVGHTSSITCSSTLSYDDGTATLFLADRNNNLFKIDLLEYSQRTSGLDYKVQHIVKPAVHTLCLNKAKFHYQAAYTISAEQALFCLQSTDGHLQLFNPITADLVFSHMETILITFAIAFQNKGTSYMLFGSRTGVYCLDIESNRLIWERDQNKFPLTGTASYWQNPDDGGQLVYGDETNTLYVVDANTGKTLHTIQKGKPVSYCTFLTDTDGEPILLSQQSNSISLHSSKDYSVVREIKRYHGTIKFCDSFIDPISHELIIVTADTVNVLRCFFASTGELLWNTHYEGGFVQIKRHYALRTVNGMSQIFFIRQDGKLHCWDARNGRPLKEPLTLPGQVELMHYHNNQLYLLMENQTMLIISLQKSSRVRRIINRARHIRLPHMPAQQEFDVRGYATIPGDTYQWD